MSVDREPNSKENFGSLQNCLVEGNPDQRARQRRIRRRALATSMFMQASLLAALLLIPLFAKPARLVVPIMTPIPPYRRVAVRAETAPRTTGERRVCIRCFPLRPANVAENNRIVSTPVADAPIGSIGDSIPGTSCGGSGCINLNTDGPRPPAAAEVRHEKRRVVQTQISAAMLIHRVEPVYPVLPKQLGRSGRVELRAVIATDGTIQSLQVVSGDPLFYQSAMEAVRQWRYRPTVLNGEPVEIDTFISVIYNMDRR
jgi:protein TonB